MSENDSDRLFQILAQEEVSQKDKQIQLLQDSLENEKDKRKEERFIFICVVILLLNVVFFSVLDNFTGPIALIILELLVLIPLARTMGVEEAAKLMSRVIERISDSLTKSND
jgi:hypothetical protein